MILKFLGTGTSHGVPVITCNCKVCKSRNKKDKRNRSSIFVTTDDNYSILVDTTPEFRVQCLKYKISKIDTVLLTHSHADHLHGIDDLRSFSSVQVPKTYDESAKNIEKPSIPIYTNEKCKKDLEFRLPYLFMPVKEGGGHAKIQLRPATEPFTVGKTIITPIPMMHGHLETTGWVLTKVTVSNDGSQVKTSVAYLTDCNYISPESIELIRSASGNLKHLIIDGLRIEKHSTHFSFLEAMEAADTIGTAEKVWFTHMTHRSSHKEVIKYIKKNLNQFPNLKKAKSVLPAYDGLELHF